MGPGAHRKGRREPIPGRRPAIFTRGFMACVHAHSTAHHTHMTCTYHHTLYIHHTYIPHRHYTYTTYTPHALYIHITLHIYTIHTKGTIYIHYTHTNTSHTTTHTTYTVHTEYTPRILHIHTFRAGKMPQQEGRVFAVCLNRVPSLTPMVEEENSVF